MASGLRSDEPVFWVPLEPGQSNTSVWSLNEEVGNLKSCKQEDRADDDQKITIRLIHFASDASGLIQFSFFFHSILAHRSTTPAISFASVTEK